MSVILQHPHAPVNFVHVGPPETPESIQQAKDARDAEGRAALGPRYAPPSDEDWHRLAGVEAMQLLVEQFGVPSVTQWLTFVAAQRGEAVAERPSHRCLADGATLTNHQCVQCGRDNS